MKILVLLSMISFSFLAHAESAKITVAGMHCGGCKKIVTKKVCENPQITFISCDVTVDVATQTGTVTITSKKGVPLNMSAIQSSITTAGEDYKITHTVVTK